MLHQRSGIDGSGTLGSLSIVTGLALDGTCKLTRQYFSELLEMRLALALVFEYASDRLHATIFQQP
ncbi:hypothetical protein [Variovorax sp. E3]|uniref:hypothetical protein n=1 Tax=Variovorax sp. E3 TaxID=1914993 RepID=UPI0018DD8D11|nr:hypothetical protein [Variovorax sp. E3]